MTQVANYRIVLSLTGKDFEVEAATHAVDALELPKKIATMLRQELAASPDAAGVKVTIVMPNWAG